MTAPFGEDEFEWIEVEPTAAAIERWRAAR
jgi:hypothetical protein